MAEKIYYRHLLIRESKGHYLEGESISESLKKKDVDMIKSRVDDYKNLYEKDSQMILITGLRKMLIKRSKFRPVSEKLVSPLIIEIERVPLDTKNKKKVEGKLISLNALMRVD